MLLSLFAAATAEAAWLVSRRVDLARPESRDVFAGLGVRP